MRALRLPAIVHPVIRHLLDEHSAFIEELLLGCGSPLHVVLPQIFSENAATFINTLRDSGVAGRVLFAKKANKARCFAERCASHELGIDVASTAELGLALAAGIAGEHIGVSGPAKSTDLLRLALHQRCLVAIDDPQELRRFVDLARDTRCKARTLLRVRAESQSSSRFGMSEDERREAVSFCASARHHMSLEGFSFHLSGYSPSERAEMAHRLVGYCLDARETNHACDKINIGGGFGVCYVEAPSWNEFLGVQSPAHYHAGKRLGSFYPYYAESRGAQMLREVLDTRATSSDSHETLSRRCAHHNIQVWLEPGRALLDQAGITAFRVQGLKDRERESGYGIVTVDGTSFSLSEQWFNSEFLPDPVLLDERASISTAPYDACVGGASCLDSDMLTWRKIRFPRKPRPNDALIYLNTAGYQMDSNESSFHERPLPNKVAVTLADGVPRWHLDSVAIA